MSFYSCVKVIYPSGGAVPFTETVSDINDAATGTPFEIRNIIKLSGYTPADVLTYWGTTSPTSLFGDSGYLWDLGLQNESASGSDGTGTCYDFNLKITSGADGYGYTFMDTWPDIFFGGYIGGYGYVDNIIAGAFDITWVRRDRSGDAVIILCIGGDAYDVDINTTVVNGSHATASKPQGLINFQSTIWAANGTGPAVTGSGGEPLKWGWADRDGIYGAAHSKSTGQGGNERRQWTDRFNGDGGTISAWADTSYTIAGVVTSGKLVAFCGDLVVVKSGSFDALPTDGNYSFNMGLNPMFVIFQSVGTVAGAGLDTSQASFCLGFVDPGLNQACFWTGETVSGNGVPLKGSRYLSSSIAMQTGFPDAVNTILSNKMAVTVLEDTGDITVAFTDTDGTEPQFQWLAVGLIAEPPPPVNPGAGIYKMVPDKTHDTLYIDTGTEETDDVAIPDPFAETALFGDE